MSLKKTEMGLKQNYLVTQTALSQNEASALVRKKFFIVRPQIVSMEICYVPCWWVVLDFNVTFFSKKNKFEGRLEFIVDEVKGCGVIEDAVKIKLDKKKIGSADLVPRKLSREQAEKKAIIEARWKVVMAKYKRPPEVEIVNTREFYRPYYEVEYTYGKEIMKQWIPADSYGNYFVYR